MKNVKALRAQFAIKDGDYFNYTAVGKGLENLRKAYGSLGYINFVADPDAPLRRGEEDGLPRHRHR